MEKGEKKEGNCDAACLGDWCEEKCYEGCKDCTMESCPESCSDECQDKCHGCAKCHLVQNDPRLLEHVIREEVCDEKCMDGWCGDKCEQCDDCDVDKEGKVNCPEDSKCPQKCRDACGDCAVCHMAIDKMMEKH